MGPIEASTNRWKSTDVEKLGSESGAVLWPLDDVVLQLDQGLTDSMNGPVDSVRAGTTSIAKKMIKSVCTQVLAKQQHLKIFKKSQPKDYGKANLRGQRWQLAPVVS